MGLAIQLENVRSGVCSVVAVPEFDSSAGYDAMMWAQCEPTSPEHMARACKAPATKKVIYGPGRFFFACDSCLASHPVSRPRSKFKSARQFNPLNPRDKMCLSKRRDMTVEEAAARALRMILERRCCVPLFVYDCPWADEGAPHFHLTKHAKPLDPNTKDRVKMRIDLPSIEEIEAYAKRKGN